MTSGGAEQLAALTSRERQVAVLVGRGATNKAVASELAISVKTVEFHLRRVFAKLDIVSRAELAHLVGTLEGRGGHRAQLPAERTRLVGRDILVERIATKVQAQRCLTLLGPGGVGKTRVALTVAGRLQAHFRDGAWLVDLVAGVDGVSITQHVATSLRLRPVRASAESISSLLGSQQRLVVLDTCEPVLDAMAELVDRLLADCPQVAIVATSRTRLGVPGEHLVTIEPLSLDRSEGPSDAASLFLDRAREVIPGLGTDEATLEYMERICHGVSALPLGIELAAALLRTQGLAELLSEIEQGSDLAPPRRSGPVRHRSLDAAIRSSLEHAQQPERALLDRLVMLAGPFDPRLVDAVESRASSSGQSEALAGLVEASVVMSDHDERGAVTFRILDPVRSVVRRELTRAGRIDEMRRLAASGVAAWLERADEGLRTKDELAWHQAIERNWHHVHTALAHAHQLRDADLAHRLVRAAIWWAWTRVRLDICDSVEQATELANADHPGRPLLLAAAAHLAGTRGEMVRCLSLASEAHESDKAHSSEQHPLTPALLAYWLPLIGGSFWDAADEVRRRSRARKDEFWTMLGRLQQDGALAIALANGMLDDDRREPARERLHRDLLRVEAHGWPGDIALARFVLGCSIRREQQEQAIDLVRGALQLATELRFEVTASQCRRELAEMHSDRGAPADALRVVAPALRRHLTEGALLETRPLLAVSIRPLALLGAVGLAATIERYVTAHPLPEDDTIDITAARTAIAAAPPSQQVAPLPATPRALRELASDAITAIEALLDGQG